MEIFMLFFIVFALYFIGAYCLWGIVWASAYAWCFRRSNRPDYNITAGEYCIEKMAEPPLRKEEFFKAGASTLKGYFYKNENSDKLVVLAHGFRAGADEFLPLIKELNLKGFNVFSYDATGCYDSKGRSLIGMCQALVDLDNVLSYLKQNSTYKAFKLYLIGHSLGGYAVLSALEIHKDILGCVALAPVCDATTLMLETAEKYMGKSARICKPFFSAVQGLTFGRYTAYNAVRGINCSKAKILIVEGDNDEIISHGKISVSKHRDEIVNGSATFLTTEGLRGGHASLWHSEKSVAYKNAVDRAFLNVKKASKKRLTYSQKVGYYERVNNALYSTPSEELIEQISKTFSA